MLVIEASTLYSGPRPTPPCPVPRRAASQGSRRGQIWQNSARSSAPVPLPAEIGGGGGDAGARVAGSDSITDHHSKTPKRARFSDGGGGYVGTIELVFGRRLWPIIHGAEGRAADLLHDRNRGCSFAYDRSPRFNLDAGLGELVLFAEWVDASVLPRDHPAVAAFALAQSLSAATIFTSIYSEADGVRISVRH